MSRKALCIKGLSEKIDLEHHPFRTEGEGEWLVNDCNTQDYPGAVNRMHEASSQRGRKKIGIEYLLPF